MKQVKVPIFNVEEFLSKEQSLAESKKASLDFFNENEKEEAEKRILDKYGKDSNFSS